MVDTHTHLLSYMRMNDVVAEGAHLGRVVWIAVPVDFFASGLFINHPRS